MAELGRTVSPSEGGSIHPGAETLSAIEGVISNEDVEKQTDRLLNLFKNKKLCVLHDRKWQHTAEKIHGWFQEKKVEIEQKSYALPGWIEEVKSGLFTHFIFMGLPPCDKRKKGPLRIMRQAKSPTTADFGQMEFNFFTPAINEGTGNLRVNNVVVVVRDLINTKKDYKQRISGHYLEHYIILDGNKHSSVLSASALGVFAAPVPQPLETDKAYWSTFPKLIVDFRPKSDVSLGLIIMTRDMAEGAPFNRVVLINSISKDTHYDFYTRVGRYTHIQSINGILLDGLDIEKVTSVFKKLPYCHIQLMVRYVHLSEQPDSKTEDEKGAKGLSEYPMLKDLPKRQSTMSMASQVDTSKQKSSRQTHSDSSTFSPVLPIPLFILGDNYPLCKELFMVLSEDTLPSPEGAKAKRLGGMSRSNRNIESPPQEMHPPALTRRSMSVPATSYTYSSEYNGDAIHLPPEDKIPEEATTPQSDQDVSQVRMRTRSFKGISASDDYMTRAEMPMSKLENLPSVNDPTDTLRPFVTTPMTPGGSNRRENLPFLPRQQYILHLPNQDLDRHTTHLYFKPSGIYLVVVDLEDLITYPLLQYETLFYWINMIHTYVTPELKRMFIVGMYKRSTTAVNHVLESTKIINNVLLNYRQAVRIPVEEHGFVYLYNREDSESECGFLCSCIVNCSRLFCQSSFYYAEDVYKSVFVPFHGFLKIATDLSLNQERIIMESKYAMGQRIKGIYGHHQHLHLPPGYFDTLSAFSPTCVSKHCDVCLLRPSVIPDLLNSCAQLNRFETQIFDDPALADLPVVSIKLLRRCFEEIQPKGKDFDMVIWWMEDLSIIYSIGSLRGDEKFFVPFLLHHYLSDRPTYSWDDDAITTKFEESTVLFTKFSHNVPLTVHLFHKIVAQILSSVLKGESHNKAFIHPDSPEAVLPLHDDNTDEFICLTWIKYRAIQNIIEFRAKVTNRIRFLKVVESKLSKSFLGTKYYNKTIDFNRVVTFRIPAEEGITRDTVEGDLLELADLESSEDPKDELVATKHLTEPGNRKKTAVMRRWADKDPEAKELPADLVLKISDRLLMNDDWAVLGSKLNLLTANDISSRKFNPSSTSGNYVLQKWKDSNRSFQDLIDGLRSMHLEHLASLVEEIVNEDDTGLFAPKSKIMEKKLPAEFFLELSKVLNIEEKWAVVGGILKLLNLTEIENLKAKVTVDKGAHVLQLWTDSHLTYQDLINALNNKSVRLDRFVPHVEAIIKSHLSSS